MAEMMWEYDHMRLAKGDGGSFLSVVCCLLCCPPAVCICLLSTCRLYLPALLLSPPMGYLAQRVSKFSIVIPKKCRSLMVISWLFHGYFSVPLYFVRGCRGYHGCRPELLLYISLHHIFTKYVWNTLSYNFNLNLKMVGASHDKSIPRTELLPHPMGYLAIPIHSQIYSRNQREGRRHRPRPSHKWGISSSSSSSRGILVVWACM
jgi:hypothetical protein